jgi:HD-GYP domain-containing protein (c-di-GMP phosphodiesterase class II)
VIGLCSPAFEALSLRLQLESLLTGFVKTVNAAIGAKDTYTVGHSERVASYSMAIGDALALDKETKQFLYVSALCHDIGKIGVPDQILKNPGLLSAEDFEEMKTHPSIGGVLIQHLPQRAAIEAGIKSHHERFDGTGYPEGLIGEKIPLFGRIVAVADAFDAMTSGRSYSGYMSEDEAVDSLLTKDDIFDPTILRAFKGSFDRGGVERRSGTVIRGKAAV